MKKLLAILLVVVLSAGMFAACTKKTEETQPIEETPASTPSGEQEVDNEAVETHDEFVYPGGIRTGMAVVTSLSSSKDAAGEKNGAGQVDSVVAAVLVGDDGRIIDARLDEAQTIVEFDSAGQIFTNLEGEVKTKGEFGAGYGMGEYSGIGVEWNQQAQTITNYVIGKTASELKGIALDEGGKATDADLSAGVTIAIGGYVNAFVKAIENAQELGAGSGDTLGIGILTTVDDSNSATPEAEGQMEAYSNYAALTVNAEGKVTSALLDASQGKVKFNVEGIIATNLTDAPLTKIEIGPNYGLAGSSGIGKEWDEQANALAEYITGKTLDEIKGIAVEAGVPTEEDLVASVTISITDMTTAIEKSYSDATVVAIEETADTIEGVPEPDDAPLGAVEGGDTDTATPALEGEQEEVPAA